MNTQNDVVQITEEDTLDLRASVVDVVTGDREILDCSNYLRINGNPLQDVFTPIDRIQYSAFQSLHEEAGNLERIGNYATGLKIHFGVDADKIRVFYQPVCLQNGTDIGSKQRKYDVIEGGWYVYDSTTHAFISKNQADAVPFVKNIKERISIVGTDSANARVRSGMGSEVEAVIFTFQKINALINDNPTQTHVGLFNSIRKVENGTAKHTLLLRAIKDNSQPAGRSAAEQESGDGFAGRYANLANLCPPNGNVTCTLE